MALKCPRCDIEMKQVDRDGIIIDVCMKCHGTWFDAKELDALSKTRGSLEALIYVSKPIGSQLKCPRCGTVTKYSNVEGKVVIDFCEECEGVWLDAGELQKLREALPERERKKPKSPKEKDGLLHALLHIGGK